MSEVPLYPFPDATSRLEAEARPPSDTTLGLSQGLLGVSARGPSTSQPGAPRAEACAVSAWRMFARFGTDRPASELIGSPLERRQPLQGYLAHEKPRTSRTLQ